MKRRNDDEAELDSGEAEYEEDDDRYGAAGGFVLGLVLGAVIGAGVMLFSAPARGAVTRRRFKRRVRDLREDARGQLDELTGDGGEELRRRRRHLERRLRRR